MKYLSVVLALCLALTIPAIAHSSLSTNDILTSDPTPKGEVQLYVTPVSEKKLDIALTNLQYQRTTIALKSLDGTITYYQDVVNKHNGYRRCLNLNQLEDGKYMLLVEKGKESRRQVIVLSKANGMLLSAIK